MPPSLTDDLPTTIRSTVLVDIVLKMEKIGDGRMGQATTKFKVVRKKNLLTDFGRKRTFVETSIYAVAVKDDYSKQRH